jgi:hypothetical protein
MFTSSEVETYLQDAWPEFDGEIRTVKLRCYINPVSRELCAEVDEDIARTLFHLVGQEMMPRSLLHKCSFDVNLPPYALTFCRDPKYGSTKVHIPVVKISKVEAAKVTPESNDFALMFTVAFEKNDPKVLNDLADLLHEKFFLTFTELQPTLFSARHDPVMDLHCRLCGAESPEFATIDNKFAYCMKDSANIQEGETLRRIRERTVPVLVDDPLGNEEGEGNKGQTDPLGSELNPARRGRRK